MLARLLRGGEIESIHRGRAVVTDARGNVHFAAGDASALIYARSALKPIQALAALRLLGAAGVDREIGVDQLAIACSSHSGSDEHQIEAACLLALAGLDESALRCPAALPADIPALVGQQGAAERLAHNCSGKHALLIWAQAASGGEVDRYLDLASGVQQAVRQAVEDMTGCRPAGPGVDGCGAPAWLLPLGGLATAFARLAGAADPAVRRVRDAMRARPDLVGAAGAADTRLMLADPRVVAKRGAEAVFAAGMQSSEGPLGVAVKIDDGGDRAVGPVVAAILRALGAQPPAELLRPPVLGGSEPHGVLDPQPALSGWPMPAASLDDK